MKGQTCIGPECTNEQTARLNVCRSHRAQQLRGHEELYPLGKYRPRNVNKPECGYEPCDRPCTGNQVVCSAHWQQLHLGKPLTPLRGTEQYKKLQEEARRQREADKPRKFTKKEFDEWWKEFMARLGR